MLTSYIIAIYWIWVTSGVMAYHRFRLVVQIAAKCVEGLLAAIVLVVVPWPVREHSFRILDDFGSWQWESTVSDSKMICKYVVAIMPLSGRIAREGLVSFITRRLDTGQQKTWHSGDALRKQLRRELLS